MSRTQKWAFVDGFRVVARNGMDGEMLEIKSIVWYNQQEYYFPVIPDLIGGPVFF